MDRLRVRLFASLREAAGAAQVTLELPVGATVSDLRAQLERAAPALRELRGAMVVAVNGEFAPDTRRVGSHDDIAVFPPVAGG